MHRHTAPLSALPPARALLALLLAVVLAVLLASCATQQPRHESQAVPGVDLAAYRSFGWSGSRAALPDAPADGAPEAPLRILDVHIRAAVRAELTRRGYVEDDAHPELRVDYETTAQDKLRSSPVQFGIGMGSWGGNVGGSVSMGTPSVESYQEGRLVIHVLDVGKNQEVWYGAVSGRVDQKSLEADAVARVVGQVFEGFPARLSPAEPAPRQ